MFNLWGLIDQFIIIGEAVNRFSETFKAQYPQVPFNEMRGLRNRTVCVAAP
ncbi:MAG: HepT-like ribonuclease domain-containing protein [Cyanobacteriota bacterium]|nr:HepT-like ribonuclease domain-containing protein [Cyanobacteriota bacterium]